MQGLGVNNQTGISGLSILLGGQLLTKLDDASVKQQIDAYNRYRVRRELPDELNPRCLSPRETVALLGSLARLPSKTKEQLAGVKLELSDPGMKLSPVDGFGVHGFQSKYDLKKMNGTWAVVPHVHKADLEAELGAVNQLFQNKEAALAAQEALVHKIVPSHASYSEQHRIAAILSQEVALVQSTLLILVELAETNLAQLGREPLHVNHEKWDSDQLAKLRTKLQAALQNAPAVGGMGPMGMPQ